MATAEKRTRNDVDENHHHDPTEAKRHHLSDPLAVPTPDVATPDVPTPDDEELSKLWAFLDATPVTSNTNTLTIEVEKEEEDAMDIVIPESLQVPTPIPDDVTITTPTVILPPINITNVVCKTSLGCVLDLDHCARHLKNTARTSFPALFVRLKNITLLLFATGSIIGTGAPTFEDNVKSMSRLVKALNKINYPLATLGNVVIENIVANFEMGYHVQITKLSAHPHHRAYCESQAKFPCINYRIKTIEPQITLRLFSNGKVICQSSKTLANVYVAARQIVPVLNQFRQRKNDPVDPATLVSYI